MGLPKTLQIPANTFGKGPATGSTGAAGGYITGTEVVDAPYNNSGVDC